MFGHRGIWHDGWKAVAYHPPYTAFDDDVWELYHLDDDFSEVHDLAPTEPERLADLQARWWAEAERNQVLPLDDRFAERFAENAERHRGGRTRYEFWAGMGHVPDRRRARPPRPLVHHHRRGARGRRRRPGGPRRRDLGLLAVRAGRAPRPRPQRRRSPPGGPIRPPDPGWGVDAAASGSIAEPAFGGRATGVGTLSIDGEDVGRFETDRIFVVTISWSGLDVGRDRVSPVSDYDRAVRSSPGRSAGWSSSSTTTRTSTTTPSVGAEAARE